MDIQNLVSNLQTEIKTEFSAEQTNTQYAAEEISLFNNNNTEMINDHNNQNVDTIFDEYMELETFIHFQEEEITAEETLPTKAPILAEDENEVSTETEETKEQKSSNENELNLIKDAVNSILENRDEELQGLKAEIDKTYENYYNKLNELDPTMAQQLTEYVNEIEELEKKLNEQKNATNTQGEKVKESKIYLDCCNAKRKEKIETSYLISDSLQEVNSLLENTTDETERKNLETQKKYLEKEQEKLENEIKEIEEETKKANRDYNAKINAQESINSEFETIKEHLAIAKANKENYEKRIIMKHPEVSEVQTLYNKAQNTYKETEEKKSNEKLLEIFNIENERNKAIIELSTESEKENSARIKRNIDAMKKYNSSAGNKIFSASNKIVNNNTTSTGFCLRDVHQALSMAYRGETTPLPTGFGSAYQTAEALRGNIPGYEDIANNFVEIEINDPSDLTNLPAGAVVVWDNNDSNHPYGHVSIADGRGNEYSDYMGTQMTGYGTKCYVFIPVS